MSEQPKSIFYYIGIFAGAVFVVWACSELWKLAF